MSLSKKAKQFITTKIGIQNKEAPWEEEDDFIEMGGILTSYTKSAIKIIEEAASKINRVNAKVVRDVAKKYNMNEKIVRAWAEDEFEDNGWNELLYKKIKF